MKNILLLLLIIVTVISCEYGTDHDYKEQEYISKFYTFNISDSSTNLIGEGANLTLLQNSKKILYTVNIELWSSEIWIYDLVTREHRIVAKDISSRAITSPDEKSLIYSQGNKLMKIDLSSGQEQTIYKSP